MNSFSRKEKGSEKGEDYQTFSIYMYETVRNKNFKSDLKISNPKTKLISYKGYKICSTQINNYTKAYKCFML